MLNKDIHILAIQETHGTTMDTFTSDGYKFFLSGKDNEKYAGVGFIVSPSMAPYIKAFTPISHRIAKLQLLTNPRPIVLYSVYAPSQLASVSASPAEDLQRKQDFWDSLEEAIIPDHIYIPIVMGDLNTRLLQSKVSTFLELHNPHVGKCFHRAPETGPTPFTPNSEFLLPFLQTHNMCLPDTFRPTKFSNRITYLEIGSVNADSRSPSNTDWSILDYIIIPILSKSLNITLRNDHKIVFSSRHLPLLTTLKMNRCRRIVQPKPCVKFSKPNIEEALAFHSALHPTSWLPSTDTIEVYTDGSCPNNLEIGPNNPAGWGFAFRYMSNPEQWFDSYAPVSTFTDDIWHNGAKVGSNNTAEIAAMIEALDFLIKLPNYYHVDIFVDSQYVLDILSSQATPSNNLTQVLQLLSHYSLFYKSFSHKLIKVASHTGIEGNERADNNANLGVTSTKFAIGRFANMPPQPLCDSMALYSDLIHSSPDQLVKDILSAASQAIPKNKSAPKQRKYVSENTLQLIQNRNELNFSTPQTRQSLKEFNKDIKKSLKQDKLSFLQKALKEESSLGPADKWKQIKKLRSIYTPSPPTVKNSDGRIAPSSHKLDILATYLQDHVWNYIAPPPTPSPSPQIQLLRPNLSPFSIQELLLTLARFHNNRSPGSDGLPMELVKWSSFDYKFQVLLAINFHFMRSDVPSDWLHSIVAMIPKPRTSDPLLPSAYRPISLTQSFYKIYACLIRTRLQQVLEPHIRDTQYGFRPKRSTLQPIFLLRRIIELFERSQTSLHLVFLDWSKAFDSVHHAAISNALLYYGVPEPLVQVVMSLYSSSTFQVRQNGFLSQTKKQFRGVRQGCPLSPYLFITVLSHLMDEVQTKYVSTYGPIPALFNATSPLWDLEYADDTVLLGRTSNTVQRFLDILVPCAHDKGLILNSDKCEHLSIDSNFELFLTHPVTKARSNIPKVQSTKYLGVLLTPNSDNLVEIRKRLQSANSSYRLLKPFLTHNAIPLKWRLQVYSQIISAILSYGLNSISLDSRALSILDAFHFKVMRRCLGEKSAFFHKIIRPTETQCSNLYIHKKLASLDLATPTPSQYLQDSTMKLLGHIFRHPEELAHQVLFGPCNSIKRITPKCRSGAPRLHWLETALVTADNRINSYVLNSYTPKVGLLSHPYFDKVDRTKIQETLGTTISDRIDTTAIYRKVHQFSHQTDWKLLSLTKR